MNRSVVGITLAVFLGVVAGPSLAAGPKANAVIFPDQGPSGTKIMLWACGFDPHPWPNGATPDHFEITVDNTTVVATVPVSRCNNVSVGFGQNTQNPPSITVTGAPGMHHIFVSLIFSNGVGLLAPAVPFTITGSPRILFCYSCLAAATPTPTPAPLGAQFSPPPPGAFTLTITGINPPAPSSGQAFALNYSLTDNWKTFGPNASTAVAAKLDGVLLNYCQLVTSFNLGQTINGGVTATAPSPGQHTIDLYYVLGLAPGCPGYTPLARLRLIGSGVLAQASQTFTVLAQPTPTPTPAPWPTR
jgi:hypothetical protein